MEAEGAKGQVFEQAKQIAKQIAFNSSTAMEYILLTNDILPQHQFIINRDKFINELDKCNISSSVLSLDEVLIKANTLVPKNKKANLYILSDMQKNFIGNKKTLIENNVKTVLVPLEAVGTNNMYIDTCWFKTPTHRLNQEEELVVKLVNNSTEDFVDIPINLYINDTLKAISGVNIKSGQSEEFSIKYINTKVGQITGYVEVSDYPVVYDNKLFFNYKTVAQTKVLLLNGVKPDKYLKSLYLSNKQNIDLSEISIEKLKTSNLSYYDLIILNNITKISSGLKADIKNFVTAGGSLLIVPSANLDVENINSLLADFNAGKFENIKYKSKKIDWIDYDNVLFRNVFIDKRKQTDFPVVGMMYKYSLFNNSNFSSLIRTENNNPVLISGNYKKGNVYVFTPFINSINQEMAKSPLFVPIFYNIAINSQLTNSIYSVLGQNTSAEISYVSGIASSDIFRITNSENVDAVASYNAVGKNLIIFIPESINNAGNYKIFKTDKFISDIALNYNRNESDLEYLDNKELQKLVNENLNDNTKIIDTSDKDINIELKNFSEGKPLWKLFLIIALVFILIEILLIKFLK